LVGERQPMERNTGSAKIPGDQSGENMDTLELKEELMKAGSKAVVKHQFLN